MDIQTKRKRLKDYDVELRRNGKLVKVTDEHLECLDDLKVSYEITRKLESISGGKSVDVYTKIYYTIAVLKHNCKKVKKIID